MSKTAVVVVHGIGDPLAGDALEALVQGLVGTTPLRESAPRTVEQRMEPGDAGTGSPLVNCYPVAGATMRDAREARSGAAPGDHEIHLREVYWGDLSRVKNSATGLLIALFDLIFGLKYIANAAHDAALAGPASKGASRSFVRFATWCSRAAFWLVRGPLFALNLLAVAVGLTTRLTTLKPWNSLDLSQRSAAIAGSVALVLFAWGIHESLRRRRWSMTTVHAMFAIGLAGAIVAWCCWPQASSHKYPAIEAITFFISLVAVLIAFAGLSMLVLHVAAWAVQRRHTRAKLLARSLVAANFCTALGIGLFTFVVMLAWTAVDKAIGGEDRLQGALHLFGLVWLAFLVMALAYLVVMARNARRASSGQRQERLRYVVSPLAITAFCGVMSVYAALVVPLALALESHLIKPTNGRPAALWDWAASVLSLIKCFDGWMTPLALAFSAGFLALLAYTRAPLLTALDLILDAVAHFRTAPESMAPQGVGAPSPERWLWESMVDRFQDVLTSVVRDHKPDRVVIVSHSQGTTVALAGLGILEVVGARSREVRQVLGTTPVDIVTMGSPVRHLYRYYMPALYRIKRGLAPRFGWLNVYREDDFIGTRIGNLGGAWPKNIRVGPRSHTNYWRDREVLDKLLTWLYFPKA